MIKKIVRFEVDKKYFDYDNDELGSFLITGSYTPNYKDLVTACKNMIEKEVDHESFTYWYYYVSVELGDALDYLKEEIGKIFLGSKS